MIPPECWEGIFGFLTVDEGAKLAVTASEPLCAVGGIHWLQGAREDWELLIAHLTYLHYERWIRETIDDLQGVEDYSSD